MLPSCYDVTTGRLCQSSTLSLEYTWQVITPSLFHVNHGSMFLVEDNTIPGMSRRCFPDHVTVANTFICVPLCLLLMFFLAYVQCVYSCQSPIHNGYQWQQVVTSTNGTEIHVLPAMPPPPPHPPSPPLLLLLCREVRTLNCSKYIALIILQELCWSLE